MLREQKRAAVLKEKRASGGLNSAPRVIVSLIVYIFVAVLCVFVANL